MPLTPKNQKNENIRQKNSKRALDEIEGANETKKSKPNTNTTMEDVEMMDTLGDGDGASSSALPSNFSGNIRTAKVSAGANGDIVKKKLVIKNFKSKLGDGENGQNEWNTISESVSAILEDRKTDTTLETLFKLVQSACTKAPPRTLYDQLVSVITKYCASLKVSLDADTTMPVTAETCEVYSKRFWKAWSDYPVKMALVRNIFLFLDRIILTQTNTDAEMMPIWETTMRVFTSVFFADLSRGEEEEFGGSNNKTFSAIFHSVQCIAYQDILTEVSIVRGLFSMISTLGLNDTFMHYFGTHLDHYFTEESESNLEKLDCEEYMRWAYGQIEHYDKTLDMYFWDSFSKKAIHESMIKRLVDKTLPGVLKKGFNDLMETEKGENVRFMFSLCSQCTGGEEYVKAELIHYIKYKGTKLMKTCPDDDLFAEILAFKKKLDKIVCEGFKGSVDPTKFRQAISDSFEYFMNLEEARIADVIVKYFHLLLRKCNKKATDENFDHMIDDAIVIFRFLRCKDTFENLYKRDLAKRLLMDRSASIDAEKSVMSKMKDECGQNFTHKMEEMFKDMSTSEEIVKQYVEKSKNRPKKEHVVNLRILTRDHWPHVELYEINLPKQMRGDLIEFEEFYKKQHGNRGVQWDYSVSTVVLMARFRPGYSKELQLSLYNAVILLLFNECDKLTVEEIHTTTKIDKPSIVRCILALVGGRGKPQILRKIVDAQKLEKDKKAALTTAETVEADTFEVNSEMQEKLFKIRIGQVMIKRTKEELKEVEEEVNADRQYQIDAAIVRIMKIRKCLSHQNLIQEILSQVKFSIKIPDIKVRIGSLIDREYIRRNADDPKKYDYCS